MNTARLKGGCGYHDWQTPLRFLRLLRPDPKPEKVGTAPIAAPQDEISAAVEDSIVCRQCLFAITSKAERNIIDGSHAHTFANPEGIVFEIACYREAWGCVYVGPTSPQFTWFAGHVWRIAVCANCHIHLGWRFSTPAGRFFHGLITDRLTAAAF